MLMHDVDEKPLSPAEKRDVRRADKALKALDAEDRAQAAHKERVRGIALENGIPMSIADEVAEKTDPAVIKPSATATQLLAFVERVERVELELAERSEDRKQVYAEARSCGFDVPTLKKVVSLRKMEEEDRLKADALLDTYMRGVGMTVQLDMGI